MVVTVLFDGIVPAETGLGGSSGRSLTLKRQPPADGRLVARFSTRSRGLHANGRRLTGVMDARLLATPPMDILYLEFIGVMSRGWMEGSAS